MDAIHTPCARWIEVSAHYDNPQRDPVFYIDGEARTVCPRCYRPLSFSNTQPVRSFQDMTPMEEAAGLDKMILQLILT